MTDAESTFLKELKVFCSDFNDVHYLKYLLDVDADYRMKTIMEYLWNTQKKN